ncbi:MAG: PH domain-containing protein, partial [Halohasta sp.]
TAAEESSTAGATGTGVDRRAAEEEEVLFEIAPSELALAGILSFDPRVPGAILALSTGSVPFVSPLIPIDAPPLVLVGLLALLVAAGVVLAWVVGAVSAVVNYWGFRLTRSAEELRYERGLLQRYSGTIPFDKIQAITITDNPLKRRAGYATLVVETAGYAPGQSNGRGSEAAVPIAGRGRVDRLADEIEACETGRFERPPKRIRRRYLVRYLLGLGVIAGLLYGGAALFASPDAVPWPLLAIAALSTPLAAHYKWVHRGYRLGEDHLITRNGFWSRETKRVAYYRIQTVIDTRTIFQRRWSVATVTADTAGSLSILGTDAAAVDIDQRDADRLRAELTDRLRTALAERRRQRHGRSFFFDNVEPTNEPSVDESPDDESPADDPTGPDSTATEDVEFHTGDGDSDEVDQRRDERDPDDVDGRDENT